MADQKINDLTAVTSLNDTDNLPVAQSSSTVRATWSTIKTLMKTYIEGLSSYFNVSSNTLDDITDGSTYVKSTNDYTDTEKTKLSGIETGADVTDATNVAAAGAVMNTGDETVAGVKTFSSFPVTPSSAPTTDYQAANKKYVDDNAGGTDTDAIHVNEAAEISGLTEKTSPASDDVLVIEDSASSNGKKKVKIGNLPTGGGGEANTASNQGAAGVGVFYQKDGIDLQFKNINAGSDKITVSDDTTNHEVDVDIDESKLDLDNIGGTLAASKVSLTDSDNRFNSSDAEDAFGELAEKENKNGFDRYDADSMPDVSWNDSTRTVSVAVKSGQSSFSFWVNNKKITKTSTQTKQIPDTTGAYYFYFDNNGDLQYVLEGNITSIDFYSYAVAAFVYWNADTSTGLFNPDEMHGKDMSGATHERLHNGRGAVYSSGLKIEGASSGSDTYTQTTSGVIYDEDIKHEIAANSSGHKFLYRYGSDGAWRTTSASLDVSYNAGGTYDVWNEWDGSTWKLTEGTSSTDYWVVFYIATPNGIFKIIGQNAYSSVRKARNAIDTEIYNIQTDGLPNPEFVWLYATIVKRDGKLQEMADGSIIYYLIQLRGGGGGSQVATYADDVPTDTSNFDGILSSADDSVQKALDTIDEYSPDDASATAKGIVELATAAETTTGTDATRAITPDGLAGSDYGKRAVGIEVVESETDTTTGDGKAFFRIPSILNGYNLVGVAANVYTAGTTGTTDIQIRNVTDSVDMLSTKLTIDSGETDTKDAATAAVIDTSHDDVATGDKIAIDIDAVSTTAAKGLYVELIFQK